MSTAYKIIIVALLVIIGILAVRACQRARKEVSDIASIKEIKEDSTAYWKDAAGREHAARRMAEGSISALNIVYRREIDSIKKIYSIKEAALQAVISAGTVTTGTVVPVIDTVYLDSSHVYRLNYHDRWISLHGEVSKDPFISYSVRDSVTLVTYTKKTGLFRKELFIDGYSHNPNAHIQGLSGFRVSQQPAKRFGIGPFVGYGFNGTSWAPSAGISVHYSLIRF